MSYLLRKAIVLSILSVLLSTGSRPAAAADAPAAAKNETQERDTAHGELEVLNVTATPSLDSLTFRGTVRNPYEQPIDGIRLIMQVRADPGPESAELVRAQKVLDAKLAATEHTPFEIEVKIDPSTLAEPGLLLRAFAMQRGDEVLTRTPIWRD